MRLLTVLAMLVASTAPASAALYHEGCGYADAETRTSNPRVSLWTDDCVGAVVWSPLIACALLNDVHAAGAHAMVLHDDGCQTGILVEEPSPGAGSLYHPGCGASSTGAGNGVARVDVWLGPDCTGAVAWSPTLACAFFNDLHLAGVHVMALHDSGCQTGALVGDPPAGGGVLDHPGCGTSSASEGVGLARADAWLGPDCVGAVVWSPSAICLVDWHVHALGAHWMVLHDAGCQTGVLVELP